MKYTFKKAMIFGLGCLMGLTSCLRLTLHRQQKEMLFSLQRIMPNLLSTVFAGQWFNSMAITDRCSTVKEQ